MGLTAILEQIRNSIALLGAQTNEKVGALEARMRQLEARMDSYDLPVDTAAGTKGKALKAMGRPVPIPDRPEVMKQANVGTDPR